MIYLVSTIVVLGVLIFVHELGHFSMAKILGVKVERFSLGFPPKMVGKKIGETEYLLSWIPLGGYVRMFGEGLDEEDKIPPEEQHRSFSHKPAWTRFLIVFFGPAANFIFAILVFGLVFIFDGVPHLGPDIGEVLKDTPADRAGLMVGDKILSIDGKNIKYWEDVSEGIRAGQGKPVEITLLRQNQTLTFTIQPETVTVQNLFGEDLEVPQIGIGVSDVYLIERVNPFTAMFLGVVKTYDVTKLTLLSLVKMIEGKVSAKNVGGPIFIAQIAGQQAQAGILNLILLTALLSVNLGIINLFPIPILDGGHLFFFLVEMILRRPVNMKMREVAQQGGLILLVLLMVLIFYNDLDRIFGFSQLFTK